MTNKRFGWHLELRHLFLLVVIAATLSDVFLRPTPQRQQFGNLIIESNYDKATTAEKGPWRLCTPGGQTLAVGHHSDEGGADGTWTYFHPTGRRSSRGRAVDSQCIDTWTTWYPDGTQLCQATFTTTRPSELKIVGGATGSGYASLIIAPELIHVAARQGQVTWANERGEISQRMTYDADKLVADLAADPTSEKIDSSNVEKLVNSEKFNDRRKALRMLRRMGIHGLPILLSIVQTPDHPVRWQATELIAQLGDAAEAAIDPLSTLMTSSPSPFELELCRVLLSIDKEHRDLHLNHIFSRAVEEPLYLRLVTDVLPTNAELLMSDLDRFLRDDRPLARRAAAAVLLHTLRRVTAVDMFDEWYTEELTPYLDTPDGFDTLYVVTPPTNSEHGTDVISMLMERVCRLESDTDPEICAAVKPVIRRWREGKIVGPPRSFGTSVVFLDQPAELITTLREASKRRCNITLCRVAQL